MGRHLGAPVHKGRHLVGGADAFATTDVIDAIIKRMQETGGPTTLTLGAIADGSFLKRSGSTVIGGVPILSVVSATATANDTTVSTTDVQMNSMLLTTPAAGSYIVIFSGSTNIGNAGTQNTMTIYSGGSAVSDSIRRYGSNAASTGNTNTKTPFACLAVVTLNGSQSLQGMWNVTAPGGFSSTASERSLIAIRYA